MNNVTEGKENGVYWKVDFSKLNPITIYVESNNTNETYEHNLLYPNCYFGYDVSDVSFVNQKLDEMINKYSINEDEVKNEI